MDVDTTARPSGMLVLGRVWLGGVVWGPIGAAALPVVYVVGRVVDAGGGSLLDPDLLWGSLLLLLLVQTIAVPVGLVVGACSGLAAGALLVLLRPLGDAAPVITWAAVLAALAGFAATWWGDGPFAWVVVVAVCLLAAYPLWRTLHRALRPNEAPR